MSARRASSAVTIAAAVFSAAAAAVPIRAAAQALVAFRVEGGGIPAPLTAEPGDAARGREAVLGREAGNCLLCHAVPGSGEQFMGNLGPSLAGVGARLTEAQLRLRLVDAQRAVPETIMPSYHRVDGLQSVAAAWRGKPILSAQQIEDAVAYLATLKEPLR